MRRKLLGAEDGPWRLTGLDPDGLDLASATPRCGLPFAERVTTAQQLRKVVVDLAAKRGAVRRRNHPAVTVNRSGRASLQCNVGTARGTGRLGLSGNSGLGRC